MIANEFPNLASGGLNQNSPCDDLGWPTFVFRAATNGYESEKHTGPLSIKWTLEGSEVYEVDGVEVKVDARKMLVLGEGKSYRSWSEDATSTTSLCVFFSNDYVREHTDAMGHGLDVLPYSVESSSALSRAMLRLNAAVIENAQRLRLETSISDVFSSIQRMHRDSIKRSARLPAAKRSTRVELFRRLSLAKSYMEDNCTKNISLASIADAACMSPYHFLRSFRDVFGTTPHQFVSNSRIQVAKDLLGSTLRPLVEVSEHIGFDSHTSFYAAFVRNTGETPQQFRKRIFGKIEE